MPRCDVLASQTVGNLSGSVVSRLPSSGLEIGAVGQREIHDLATQAQVMRHGDDHLGLRSGARTETVVNREHDQRTAVNLTQDMEQRHGIRPTRNHGEHPFAVGEQRVFV